MDDVELDEPGLRALLRAQHPDLADLALRPAPLSWDNQLWCLGEELVVRLPRTERAPDLLRKEHTWLPRLAPRLPLPVPVPLRFGEPTARFPKPWTIAAWVPGEPADRAPISRGHHAADALAGFLRALHQQAPPDAPTSRLRSVPLGTHIAGMDTQFRDVASRVPRAVLDVWHDALAAPGWAGPPVWLHGDLHPANVVVADGTLAGIVDFGELCAGDPAADLAAAWLLLPAGANNRFFEVYAPADEATIRRARGWAVLLGVMLVCIGQAGERGLPGGKPTWAPAGTKALDRVLASGGGAGATHR
ncbi:phosphotransferase [Streptomyces johnsoniae]|uniref:Phosphotransferase n=1 Tax=Streptomyces johnsoniae TaxID=3075532 RepID=A0ABU2S5K8_9ACTN|nr:phosphotransferase [Streptomyces sp. DSM 41886]MDT0444257.1 phosphotransferase [Streptomyces sp. DSM 41886]